MVRIRKRSLIFLLIATLLAFAIALPAKAATPVFSVTLPTSLPVTMDADGNISVSDSAAITNNGDGAVIVSGITVTPLNSWALCADSAEVSDAEIGSKCFAMRFNGADAAINGSVDVSGFSAVAAGGSMALAYAAAVTPQIESVSQTIANVVFTVSWSGHGPLTGIAVTTAPTKTSYDDGDAFDSAGMAVSATYADGTTAAVTDWTVTNGAALSEGQTSVTVSYTEGGVTQTATTPITVAAVVQEPVYAILYSNGELVFQRGSTPESGRTVTKTYSGVEDTDDSEAPWYAKRRSIKTVTFADAIRPNTTACWFEECENLTAINGIEKLDTSLVTNMEYMFDTCESLEEIDVSGFDTSNVTNLRCMFCDCSELTALAVDDWDVSSVTNFTSVFSGCSALADCDVSGWNTESATTLASLFNSCSRLTVLDLSGWHTSGVRSMSKTFRACYRLTACGAEAWNTSAVTNFESTFYGCTSLTSLDLSAWDVGSATSITNMFSGCTGLVTLDLSSWDTSAATNTYSMFTDCSSLTTIWASDSFVIPSGNSGEMFTGAYALVGGNGTQCTSANHPSAYARIDRAGTPGFFTEKTMS